MTCQDSGLWTAPPRCQQTATDIGCGRPPPIANGDVQFDTTRPGATAFYSCRVGYTLVGNAQITCQQFSNLWTTPPTCQVDCGLPPSVANGQPQFSATVLGSTVYYTCENGYEVSGNSRIQCQANGQWTQPPSCNGMNFFNETTICFPIFSFCFWALRTRDLKMR